MQDQTPSKPRIWRETSVLLREAARLVRAGGSRLALVILVSQLVILTVALPVIRWLFKEALRSAGMPALDLAGLALPSAAPVTGLGMTLTVTLILVIITVAFWMIALQFTAIVVVLRWPGAGLRDLVREMGRVARKLLRPSSASLVLYLFLLVPITGYGFMSTLTQGIAIPFFVSGELMKSPSTAVGLFVFVAALVLLNIRLAPMVPVFVLTEGGKAARSSLRLTRGLRASLPIVLAVTAAMLLFGVLSAGLVLVAVIPTAFTDLIAPGASPVVAAYSLGIAQVVGFLIVGFATASLAAVLIARVLRGEALLAPGVTLVGGPGGGEVAAVAEGADRGTGASPADDGARSAIPSTPRRTTRRTTRFVVALATLMSLAFGTLGLDTMHRLSEAPQSYVLGHRGFSEGGVENTLSGLDAAHAAGADFVEMDVMQTADGKFVAMHDASLSRLADRPDLVKDLTFDELTALTVRDQYGHEDRVPGFAEYVEYAESLGMPLLIEIKLHGGETPDHVELLVAELERIGSLERHIYHSLDAPSVERLKQLRPDLSVGYTMAFAAVAAPDTSADFIVVEQWTATERIQQSARAAGLGFMVWTVNDDAGMTEMLRRNVDGIITDHPDAVMELREQMDEEQGLSDVLVDALSRFVTAV